MEDGVVRDIAASLAIAEPDKIRHLGARLQRYTDRYFAAQQGHVLRLTPGSQRPFMRSLAGRIESLSADLAKAQSNAAVQERYKEASPSREGATRPSLEELSRQLGYMRQIALEIVEAPPRKTAGKGRPVLDHAVGSLMALFETMSGERARTCAGGRGGGEMLTGPSGAALRKIFEAIDPAVSETTLVKCVDRLSERFEGRAMRESDFDWISAIEDDGTFHRVQAPH